MLGDWEIAILVIHLACARALQIDTFHFWICLCSEIYAAKILRFSATGLPSIYFSDQFRKLITSIGVYISGMPNCSNFLRCGWVVASHTCLTLSH